MVGNGKEFGRSLGIEEMKNVEEGLTIPENPSD